MLDAYAANHANPGRFQTFSAIRIPDLQIKTACEEAGCDAWAKGWTTAVDESTALGRGQAEYIRTRSGRTFAESKTQGLTVFRFAAHQRCFREHQTQGALLTVRAGDLHRSLGTIREHTRSADWQEHFGEHQQALADEQARG